VTYNSSPNQAPFRNIGNVQKVEAKFQVSFKFDIIEKFWNDRANLAFAYTAQSYWQVYNSEYSSPFRETNHEPEVFLTFTTTKKNNLFFTNYYILGLVHQSNGRNAPLSKSWNRIYATGFFKLRSTIFSLKIWHRFKEDKKSDPLQLKGDDNPDILDYSGHFELRAAKKIKDHTIALMLRNNLKKENKGAYEVTWSFPISNFKIKGYFQYFNGYYESLLDYNDSSNRIGLGLLVSDWL